MIVLRVLGVVAGLLMVLVLVRAVLSSSRRLNKGISALREEEATRNGPPPDPYIALAQLYAEDRAEREKPTKRRHPGDRN